MGSARASALRVLQRWDNAKGGAYAELMIDQEARGQSLSTRDRAQLNALVLGTLRNRTLIDHWLAMLLAKKNPGKLKPDVRRLLQVALFDLLLHDAAPHAAVSEAVALAPRPLRPLANAVLRRADRERDSLARSIGSLPLHVRYSHPQFLVDLWRQRFGEAGTENLLRWNNTPPLVCHRINRLHPDNPPGPVEFVESSSPDFESLASGRSYAQDPSTAHAPQLLAPGPGECILDACAAPGGKTALLAELMGNTGSIVATDSAASRLETLAQNLPRLHVSNAEIRQHDWSLSPCEAIGKFDAILLDVPCSNTGVFRRRVDARWRIDPNSCAALNRIQLAIASNAIHHLKPGGRVVYSTCSIEPSENLQVVETIIARHPQLKLESERSSLPHRDSTDGAYAALLLSE